MRCCKLENRIVVIMNLSNFYYSHVILTTKLSRFFFMDKKTLRTVLFQLELLTNTVIIHLSVSHTVRIASFQKRYLISMKIHVINTIKCALQAYIIDQVRTREYEVLIVNRL